MREPKSESSDMKNNVHTNRKKNTWICGVDAGVSVSGVEFDAF